jgi:hypothetical protein
VGVDGAKLEQCGRLNSRRLLLSSQVQCLTRVLPSLVEASSQEMDRAPPRRCTGRGWFHDELAPSTRSTA